MATLLKFKQGDSGTELNLNSSTTGFTLEEDGWFPVVASPIYMGDPPPVLETINLILNHTSQNNLAASMQSLHEMQVLADRYINDRTQETPVWMHAQMNGETGERRALVYEINIQYGPQYLAAGSSIPQIPLVLTVARGPYWENPTVTNTGSSGNLTGACVTWDYTTTPGDNVGDVPARIRLFSIELTDTTTRYWMGFRSANKHGATGLSNFETIWECEDGTNNPDSVETGITDQADATASGGNIVRLVETDVDWDDGSWRRVMLHTLTQASTNEEDQFGNFLWLLRAKVPTSSSTWELYFRFHSNTSGVSVGISKDIIEINDTDWRFYEMGINPISLRNMQAIIEADQSKTQDGDFSVSVYGRRTSGTSNLYLDCIIPLPIDEGFAKLDFGKSYTRHYFGQSPKGEWGAMVYSAGATLDICATPESIENFSVPVGDGRLYTVFERASASDITDVVNLGVSKYYERWLSLRGNE